MPPAGRVRLDKVTVTYSHSLHVAGSSTNGLVLVYPFMAQYYNVKINLVLILNTYTAP